MSGDQFSTFDNADTASYPVPAGLQGGKNVLLQQDALAYAIATALAAIARNIAMAGNITAANLSGTNTGDQPPLGLTLVLRPANATVSRFTSNRITAINVALTTPATPNDGDVILTTIESASFTGCSLIANGTPSGVTIEGLSTFNFNIVPCAVWWQYNLAAKNWFALNYRLGSLT